MHLINFKNLSTKQLIEIIDKAIEIKQDSKKYQSALNGRSLAMIFQKTSTRTRVSFEVGMKLLGGHAVFLNKNDIRIGERESIEDIALVLSRYVDIIMYRALKKEDLYTLANKSTVPVINGLDINEHPCQILADFMTIKEYKDKLNGLNFVFIGDGNDNLNHSYLLGCPLVGMNITVITHKNHWPSKYFLDKANQIAEKKNIILF